jgi:diacylglycerol O-acyltransferase-1
LICVRCHEFREHDVLLGLALYFLIPCHLLAAYLIELAAAQQARVSRANALKRDGTTSPTEDQHRKFQATWKLVAWAHGVNITLALAITSVTVYYYIHHPLIGTLTELHAIIVWLKTASYAFTNRDLRHAYLHPITGELSAMPELYAKCPYPQNITMGNLVYFWSAPTLVYQPVYPRTAKIRWVFVAKRLSEGFCLSVFIWFASAQYAAPVLRNSLDKIASLDFPSMMERLLKLSTISLVIWLAGFFALFHSFLNALAEVTRFADRSFYDDWWNSDSLGTYWKTWNKPVYQFFKRHVYSPMLGRDWHPLTASVAVFFISGVLHELLVGVPTHNIIGKIRMSSYWMQQRPLTKSLNRRCLLRHVLPARPHRHHEAAGTDELGHGPHDRQLHLLGILHHLRAAVCRVELLLCLAPEVLVWESGFEGSLMGGHAIRGVYRPPARGEWRSWWFWV